MTPVWGEPSSSAAHGRELDRSRAGDWRLPALLLLKVAACEDQGKQVCTKDPVGWAAARDPARPPVHPPACPPWHCLPQRHGPGTCLAITPYILPIPLTASASAAKGRLRRCRYIFIYFKISEIP